MRPYNEYILQNHVCVIAYDDLNKLSCFLMRYFMELYTEHDYHREDA